MALHSVVARNDGDDDVMQHSLENLVSHQSKGPFTLAIFIPANSHALGMSLTPAS